MRRVPTASVTRAWIVLRKATRELRREPVLVALTLVFAPVMVLLYQMTFPEAGAAYRVVVVDEDDPGQASDAAAQVLSALRDGQGSDGRPLLDVRVSDGRDEARAAVERRDAVALVVLPAGFSRSVAALADDPAAPPVTYTLSGDLTSPGYLVAAVLVDAQVQGVVADVSGRTPAVVPAEEALGDSAGRSDFEVYVPGLMVFAVIMLVFLAAMVVAREFESGGMRRLRLTRMTGGEYLVGTTVVLTALGGVGVLLTVATASALGFTSAGPLWVAAVALVLATLSVVGVGMAVAAMTRTVVKAFVVANFPLAILMFFSGALFPMPRITWFELAGHPIGPFELLPPTHAVTVLNRVVTLGASAGDVLVDLVLLAVLTAVSLAVGVALLRRAAAGPSATGRASWSGARARTWLPVSRAGARTRTARTAGSSDHSGCR